jgi:hypothetical protein
MFQRTIPGFEPSPETFALSVEGLTRLKTRLTGMGIIGERSLDLLTAIGTGITDQQISNGIVALSDLVSAARVCG